MKNQIADDLYLAMALIKECNFACGYCHPFGESKITSGNNMTKDEALGVIDAAHDAGFRVYRFTGGECTILPWFKDVLQHTLNIDDDIRLNVCTNGSTLGRYRELFKDAKDRLSLRVSLDSLNQQKTAMGIDKVLTPALQAGLEHLAEDGVYTRFNVVVTQRNVDEVPAIIQYASTLGFDVKLLDLYIQDEYIATHGKRGTQIGSPVTYWKENYVDLATLVPTLQALSNNSSKDYNKDGGFGIPMYAFDVNNIKVIFKDSTQGAHFSQSKCIDECPQFMKRCQEGVYTPHISSNLVLHINGCANSSHQWDLRGKTRAEQTKAFDSIIGTFFTDITHVNQPPRLIQEYLKTQSAPGLVQIQPITGRNTC